MNVLKIDEEKLIRNIEAHHDQHGEYPYLIMNDETRKILPKENNSPFSSVIINSNSFEISPNTAAVNAIKINDKTYTLSDNTNKDYGKWHSARILVDNKLKFGEVHVG